jgi:large subunit ribosomal protein L32e
MKSEAGKGERTGKTAKSKEELMAIRKGIKKKTPKFLRQEWFRKKHRLGKKWRKPRGIHSKLREHEVARGALPRPGYGSPSAVRGLNRQGCREVLVKNMKDMERLNHKEEVAIIASGVGRKKRLELLEFAVKNNIKVGNKGKFI